MLRVSLRTVVLALISFGCQAASAQTHEPYTQARFEALQAQNALVLIDVYATWCPTCAQQQTVLAAYQETRPGVPLHILRVDFDRQKSVVRQFRAPRQSTLLLYRGAERVWLSVAETRRDAVFAAIDAAAARR